LLAAAVELLLACVVEEELRSEYLYSAASALLAASAALGLGEARADASGTASSRALTAWRVSRSKASRGGGVEGGALAAAGAGANDDGDAVAAAAAAAAFPPRVVVAAVFASLPPSSSPAFSALDFVTLTAAAAEGCLEVPAICGEEKESEKRKEIKSEERES